MALPADSVPHTIRHPQRNIPPEIMSSLFPTSREAISRLLAHRPVIPYNPSTPKTAAVLLGLFESTLSPSTSTRSPGLQVLLTTRSATLRTHPSQTALPGGKCDVADGHDVDITARREAEEEVGLGMALGEEDGLWRVTALEPFMSKYGLIVYPVVYLITSPSILSSLHPSPTEVSTIFSHPLESCQTGVYAGRAEDLVERGGEWWPYEEEGYNHSDTVGLGGKYYRMHRFRTTASPLKGLTSDILISTSTIAFARQLVFEVHPPDPMPTRELIWEAVRTGRAINGVEDKRARISTATERGGEGPEADGGKMILEEGLEGGDIVELHDDLRPG